MNFFRNIGIFSWIASFKIISYFGFPLRRVVFCNSLNNSVFFMGYNSIIKRRKWSTSISTNVSLWVTKIMRLVITTHDNVVNIDKTFCPETEALAINKTLHSYERGMTISVEIYYGINIVFTCSPYLFKALDCIRLKYF